MLADLIGDANPFGAVHVSEHFEGDGTTLFAAAERMQLEGIVSKRASSHYKSGRSSLWQKTKCMTEGEFVVVGMEPNPGGAPFALLAREAASWADLCRRRVRDATPAGTGSVLDADRGDQDSKGCRAGAAQRKPQGASSDQSCASSLVTCAATACSATRP
jgi:hypothetical protein